MEWGSDILIYVGSDSYTIEGEGIESKLFQTVYNSTNNGKIPIISIFCYMVHLLLIIF